MKLTFHIALATVLMLSCHAKDKASKIYGTWSSDREASSDYLLANAKLNDYQKLALPRLFGRMDVTYREDGTGTAFLKAGRIPKKDGGEIVLEETSIDFTFEIIGESESQVIIKTTSGDMLIAECPFSLVRFHDRDTASVAISDGITDINGREFFKRIKKEEAKKTE